MKGKCDLCKKETDSACYRGITHPFPYYDKNKVQVLCKECYDKGMQENHIIKIKVGDTVIRRDGLKGKIICLDDFEEGCSIIKYENGQTSSTDLMRFENFYLIGKTVIGNKCSEEDIEQLIEEKEEEILRAKKEKDQLRKQLWRLREEMVEDWRERKALRELRASYKKENQAIDEQTTTD